MRIVVCCKLLPSVADLKIMSDGSVSLADAEWKINEFDLNAVEAGVELAKATEGQLIAVTVGSRQIESGKLRKDLLSRGPDELYQVSDDLLADADPVVISQVIANVVDRIGADLVICGDGSEDYFNQQTGLQLGERLGWANLSNIDDIFIDGDTLIVERLLEKKIEVLEVQMPAVLTVTTSINIPSRPNMRAVIAAGKKPVTVWSLQDLESSVESPMATLCVNAVSDVERKRKIISADDVETTAVEFVRALKSEGVL